MLSNRIERLLEARQIRKDAQGYVLSSHILYYTARVINIWGRLLGFASMRSIYHKKK